MIAARASVQAPVASKQASRRAVVRPGVARAGPTGRGCAFRSQRLGLMPTRSPQRPAEAPARDAIRFARAAGSDPGPRPVRSPALGSGREGAGFALFYSARASRALLGPGQAPRARTDSPPAPCAQAAAAFKPEQAAAAFLASAVVAWSAQASLTYDQIQGLTYLQVRCPGRRCALLRLRSDQFVTIGARCGAAGAPAPRGGSALRRIQAVVIFGPLAIRAALGPPRRSHRGTYRNSRLLLGARHLARRGRAPTAPPCRSRARAWPTPAPSSRPARPTSRRSPRATTPSTSSALSPLRSRRGRMRAAAQGGSRRGRPVGRDTPRCCGLGESERPASARPLLLPASRQTQSADVAARYAGQGGVPV